MNSSSIQPERAWQMALDQLRMDMSKASFDNWVRDTRFISFEDGTFTVGTANEYGREWLASRLTSTVTRFLTGTFDQQLEVQFVVAEEAIEEEIDDSLEEESSLPTDGPDVLSLQAEYQSIYDEIVQPHQVIVVPGYFLRYIPVLGQELAWLYVGFRQAAYEAGAAKQPGKKFGALQPLQRILYASLDQLAAKCFEHPTQPAWREGKVSAKLHATGGGVEGGAGGGLIVGDAQSAQNPMDLMLFGIHRLDLERAVPPHRVFQIDHLAG